jgi:FMN-dependent oxidoreductase (nitrilotriacetate monooxygenase family)
MPNRSMILSAFFFNPQGDHRMAWRHPSAKGAEIFDFKYYKDMAQTVEAAGMDALFVADHLAIWNEYDSAVRHYANARLEPFTLLAALAAVTQRIGLICTTSTSYTEPYNVARAFATLDHISDGRAAWNVVTSAMGEEAKNFGRDGNIDHARRYERADEFLDVTKALWDSWEDEALIYDKENGAFADISKVHAIEHEGPHFKVQGPLNVARPPQGHPLIVQAGSSKDGKQFATMHADLHFAIFDDRDKGIAYRQEIDTLLAINGREPSSFKILPGVLPIAANSRSEALERQEYLTSLMPDRLGVDLLSSWTGVDFSALSPDGPMPPLPEERDFHGQQSALKQVREWSNKNLSIREVARKLANTGSVPTMAGTATDIADQLEDWFSVGAADGFNLMFPLLPDDLTAFTTLVMPELKKRGHVPVDGLQGTLRERLGLPKPANRFSL